MLSRFFGTALVMFAIGGFVLAGEHNGVITKADKDSITVTVFKKRGEKGEEKTFKVGKGVKITKGEDTVESKDFAELVTKATGDDAPKGRGPKGVRAKITTDDDDKVTKIEIRSGKGKAKKTDDK